MGWTFKHVSTINGKIDRKKELDLEFTEHSSLGTWEILKSSMVGDVYYAACRRTVAGETPKVFAIVALTDIDKDAYDNFGYKDMTEEMGPYEHDCPKSIIDLLDPTDNEYANEWRRRCLEKKHAKKELSALPIGAVIKYKNYGGPEIMLRKCAPCYQFKRPWWCVIGTLAYMPKTRIPHHYTVVTLKSNGNYGDLI